MVKEFAGLPIVADQAAPDVHADEALGFEVFGGVIRITLATRKMQDGAPPSDPHWVVIGRLAMPVRGAQALALGLLNYLKTLGIDQAPPRPDDAPSVQ